MLKVANSVISASRITGTLPVANGGTGVTTSTGTGNTVLSAAPTLSGDVNLSTGNLVIGTDGKGIDFSVTSSGSGTMTSELLADYEEGTWTPVGNNITLTTANGKYVKVGRLVMLQGQIRLPVTADTSALQITGLPFANGSGSPSAGSIGYISPATATGLNSNIDAGSSTLKFYGNVGESYPNNALWSNAFINFAICYQA